MASKAAAKTVAKVAKTAKSVPKPKAAAPAKKAAEPKTFAAKENAGFKENTARDLVNHFQGKSMSISTAQDIQTHIFNALRTSLAKQGRVAVPGLGVFKVGWVYSNKSASKNRLIILILSSSRAARTGRNPKTGEALQIPQTNTIRFSATPTWKKEVATFKVQPKVKKAKADAK